MSLALQFAGALGILVPFALLQAGRLSRRAVAYLVLNLVGSGVLAWIAWAEGQWGFVLIEAVWALAAAWALVSELRLREAAERTNL